MPLNIPTVTTNDISFGPGYLLIGASGTTPTVQLGAIGEDGVSFEITRESRDIVQGNPKTIEYSYTQAQGATLKVTSIEWDVTNFAYALGSGVTTSVVGNDALEWGGDPLVSTVALQVIHQMPVTGHTLNIYAWKCVSASGFPITFSADENKFGYNWKLQRSATNWGGVALASTKQLFQIYRAKL